MKTLTKTFDELQAEKRWDIDYHTPAILIEAFRPEIVRPIGDVARVVKRDNRNPLLNPDGEFQYIDISVIDVTEGAISESKPTMGAEAPSRARKVVKAFDILVSTVRPTRGAVAVVPIELHDEIASTGYSIVRANEGTNPFYLHFALRLPSTREQFRKWSTGSSYPAILDDDVTKTRIPIPERRVQNEIAAEIFKASSARRDAISKANSTWSERLAELTRRLEEPGFRQVRGGDTENDGIENTGSSIVGPPVWDGVPTIESIDKARKELGILG